MFYKLLLDPAKYLSPCDFLKEREVTINRLVREALPAREGEEKQWAPMLYIRDKAGNEYPRPLKVPKSVLHGLSLMLGTETDAWVGKKITIFAAVCMAFGSEEECLRVRFPQAVDVKVRAWLRKRKAPATAYIIREMPQATTTNAAPASATAPATAATPIDPVAAKEIERQAAIERGEA